jgi:GTPase SAR1 family protein
LIVFDITSKGSFDEVRKINKIKIEVYMKTLEKTFESVKGFPVVICGNKVDLENKRKVDIEDAKKYIKDYGFEYFETSAKSGTNVTTAFEALTKKIIKSSKLTGKDKDKKCILC